MKHVYFMAADSLRGRMAGTPGNVATAQYLKQQYVEMGLKPYFSEWEDHFLWNNNDCANIVGVIEGSDPLLKDEYIVIGAHYDHIGLSHGEVCNGADDNASGSAALIEIARQLLSMDRSLIKRSIIIAAFDAEEQGLCGSQHLCNKIQKQQRRVVLMMSIDMVGWYGVSGYLKFNGTATLKKCEPWMTQLAKSQGISIRLRDYETSIFTATDTQPFANVGVATLAVTTGLKSPYHKPEDDADLIDYEGLEKVSTYLAAVVQRCASDEVQPSGKLAPIHTERQRTFEWGVLAGPTLTSMLYNRSHLTGDSRWGAQVGLALHYSPSKKWSFQLTPTLTGDRFWLIDAANPLDSAFALRQGSLDIPFTVRWTPISDNGITAYLMGGLNGSLYLSSTTTGSLPAYGNHAASGFGWHWGFGFRFGRLFIEDMFQHSLLPLYSDQTSLHQFQTSIRIGFWF